jgi:ribosome maturation factor RimP
VSIVERVRATVEPLLAHQSLSVYDVELSGSTLRILIQGPEGVDLDEIAHMTRLISVALDDADPIPGKYTLEVSSPGLERPLRTPEHFRGAIGETVTLKLVATAEERRVKGTLADADDLGVTVDGHRIAYDDIDKARTVFEWGPAPKPGKQAAHKKPGKQAANKKAQVR